MKFKEIICSVFLIFLIPSFSISQTSIDSTKKWGWYSDFYGREINYGQYNPDLTLLNNHLTQNYNFSFEPIHTIGIISKGGLVINREFNFDASAGFNYFIPNSRKYSDSLSLRLSGFQMSISPIGFDVLHKSKKLDFIIGSGFNFGRFVIKRFYKNGTFDKYKNPYFSPKILTEFRVIIKRISLGIRAEYCIEIGDENWKIEESNSPILPAIKTTGFMYQAYIGLGNFN